MSNPEITGGVATGLTDLSMADATAQAKAHTGLNVDAAGTAVALSIALVQMATNTFKRKISAGIGTTATAVGGYQVLLTFRLQRLVWLWQTLRLTGYC